MTNKRKNIRLFLKEPPQKYFLLLQLGILLATLVFLLSIIMTSVSTVMESAYGNAVEDPRLNRLFDEMTSALFKKISVLFAVVFFLSALLGLFFLERLTGPLIRIQKALEEIANGRIPSSDIYLRKTDFPKELAEALSGAIAYLRKKKAGF